MAGRGPVPKPPDQRRRRPAEHRVQLPRPPIEPAPYPFPDGINDPRVKSWWQAVVDSPVAAHYQMTDWALVDRLVPLVARYFEAVDEGEMHTTVSVARELRLHEATLLVSIAERMRARFDIDQPAPERPPTRQKRLRVVDPNASSYTA